MINKKYETFEELVIYKNIHLIQTSIHIFIVSKMLYGTQKQYEDLNFIESITPIIKSYRSSLFRGSNNDVYMDLLLNIETNVTDDVSIATFKDNFTINLSLDIDNDNINLRILNIDVGDNIREYSKGESLKNNLIPYIYKDNYEMEAELFLSKYYPEALVDPIPINIKSIINNIGLKLEYAILEPNIRGMIAFRDKYIYKTDYMSEGSLIKEFKVQKGTIIINERLMVERGLGAHNNSLIHECLHWYLHKNYMELKILMNDASPDWVSYRNNNDNNNNDLVHLENQVKQITPLILMPKESSIAKFEQLISKYKDDVGIDDPVVVYKASLREFARYFNVSLKSAEIRLKNLGYTDNLYSKNLLYEKKYKEIRFISNWDYEQLIYSNKTINYLVEKQILKYIDGFVILNKKPYVEKTKEGYKITKYGFKNIRECTIAFDVTRNRNLGFRKSDKNSYAMLYHETSETYAKITVNKNQLDILLKQIKNSNDVKQKKEFFKDFRYDEINLTFSEYLHVLMDRHNKSINQLVISSGLSVSIIKKYRSMSETSYTVETTLAICAGLKAYPYESINLLSLMGWNYEELLFKNAKIPEKHKHYYYLITNEYDSGIDKWNEYLVKNGFKALN